ncbi:MAG: hypothetical protein Q9176_002314 [Flavoplaca citrina]
MKVIQIGEHGVRAIKLPPVELEPGALTEKPRQRISVKDIRLDGSDQTAWHEYEIPKELEILQSRTPAKIRIIIQGTLEERRATRLSKLPAPVRKSPPVDAPPKVAGSSLKGSERHTGSTSSDRTQSFDLSLKSTTSLGSSTVGMDSNNSLDRKAAEANSQPTNTRLRKCREKPSAAHGLLKMLRNPLRNPREILGAPGMEPEPSTYDCTSCFDKVPKSKAIGVPCQHRYCAICFSQLITTALQNENSFPPKCCLQEIPRRVLKKHLRAKEVAVFDDKALEYAVAIGSRYYCARPKCSKWIDTTKARTRNGALRCPHCSYRMCTICRGPVHPVDQDCPQDFGLNSTLEQAKRAGWQRCYKCRAYTCGAKWQTCSCTEDDQARRTRQILQIQHSVEAETRAEDDAEEQEIRAAIAAVRKAENRAARIQRRAERRREKLKLEEERQRVQNIAHYYSRLRIIMAGIQSTQNETLTQRHACEMDDLEAREITLALGGGRGGDLDKADDVDDGIERTEIKSTMDTKEKQRQFDILTAEARKVKRRQWAEWKWMGILNEERLRMLEDDERRMVANGSEIGGVGLGSDEEAEVKAEDGTEWWMMPGASGWL